MDEFDFKKALKFMTTVIITGVAVIATLFLVVWTASKVPVDMNPPPQQINHNNYAEHKVPE